MAALQTNETKLLYPSKDKYYMQVFFPSGNYYKGNKVNMLNMPGVGLTKLNGMLPSCPSSFCHKQALHCPDGHLILFPSLISLGDLVLL